MNFFSSEIDWMNGKGYGSANYLPSNDTTLVLMGKS